LRIDSCKFEIAAYGPRDYPRRPGHDVVFMGRSNVGKSSLINRMLGVRGLARTSSQPGRTQSVNFYRVNERCYFVDLPGYGYAKAPAEVRSSWKPMVEGFLDARKERIALALLIVDARHAASPLDITMRDWLNAKGIRYIVTATKSDKLSGNGRARATRTLSESLGSEPLLVSAQTALGIPRIWKFLDQALAEAKDADKGQRWTSKS
jgi:GTP-binding protein